MTVTYFAYGSNLLFARLQARCPSIVNLGMARLQNHRLSFNKPGGDRSGKCGIEVVQTDEYVIGVLYQMVLDEKPILDHIEGVGHGYRDQQIMVSTDQGHLNCFTYYPTRLDAALQPWDWYKAFVVEGARENKFPGTYLSMIEAVNCLEDPDTERRRQNLQILGDLYEL